MIRCATTACVRCIAGRTSIEEVLAATHDAEVELE